MRPRVVVLGEKPQGSRWLRILLESGKFDIIAGVPRFTDKRWWDDETFPDILKAHDIPIVRRSALATMEYDILWSLMYGFIIEGEHIARAKWYGLNLHESPLPRYRGCNGYSHAILEGATTFGTTFHTLAPELDAGEIIDQEIFPMEPVETAKELYARTMIVSEKLFARNIDRVANNDLLLRPNHIDGEPIRPRSSLDKLKHLDDALLDTPELLWRAARAFDFVPFEPAAFIRNDTQVLLFVDGSQRRNIHDDLPVHHHPRTALACALETGGCRIGGFPRKLVLLRSDSYQQQYRIYSPRTQQLSLQQSQR